MRTIIERGMLEAKMRIEVDGNVSVLNLSKASKQFYTVDALALMDKLIFHIKTSMLNLLAQSLVELDVMSIDLYKTKTKEIAKKLKKHIELIDLIEEIDKEDKIY